MKTDMFILDIGYISEANMVSGLEQTTSEVNIKIRYMIVWQSLLTRLEG